MLPIASCLFVDPGPSRSAFARVVAMPDGRPEVRGASYHGHDRTRLWTDLDALHAEGAHLHPSLRVFVIETIVGEIYKGRSAAQVLATKKAEGRIQEAAEIHGVVPVEVTASDVRKTLVGNGQATNAQIRAAVRGIFGADLQRFRCEEDEHMLDAIGGGVVVLARLLVSDASPLAPAAQIALRSRLMLPGGLLPAAAAQAVGRVVYEEKLARAAKKQAKAAGVKLPRKTRRRTREQERDAQAKALVTRMRKR